MKMETSEKFLWNRVLWWLGRQARSEKEVREYLTKKLQKDKVIDENFLNEIVEKLKELKFVDDVQFAKMWVRSRKDTRGKRRLELELKKKGIKKEIIDELLNKKNENQPNGDQSLVNSHWSRDETEIDEEKTAKELAEKRMKRYVGLPAQKARERLVRYLAGRGFGWETIKKTLVPFSKSSSNIENTEKNIEDFGISNTN